jgi:hypothetical protein
MADVRWAVAPDGTKVPLDEHEQRDYGPERYRIVADGIIPEVVSVPEESTARVFVDHRYLCEQPRAI